MSWTKLWLILTKTNKIPAGIRIAVYVFDCFYIIFTKILMPPFFYIIFPIAAALASLEKIRPPLDKFIEDSVRPDYIRERYKLLFGHYPINKESHEEIKDDFCRVCRKEH